jgi:hypothetical protein
LERIPKLKMESFPLGGLGVEVAQAVRTAVAGALAALPSPASAESALRPIKDAVTTFGSNFTAGVLVPLDSLRQNAESASDRVKDLSDLVGLRNPALLDSAERLRLASDVLAAWQSPIPRDALGSIRGAYEHGLKVLGLEDLGGVADRTRAILERVSASSLADPQEVRVACDDLAEAVRQVESVLTSGSAAIDLAKVARQAGDLLQGALQTAQTADHAFRSWRSRFASRLAEWREEVESDAAKLGAKAVAALEQAFDEVESTLRALLEEWELAVPADCCECVTPPSVSNARRSVQQLAETAQAAFSGLVSVGRQAKSAVEAIRAGISDLAGLPKEATVRYDWSTPLQAGSSNVFLPEPDARLDIAIRGRIQAGGGDAGLTVGSPEWDARATLQHFGIDVAGLATIDFERIQFRTRSGFPLETDVKVRNVRFGKFLDFIRQFASALGSDLPFRVDAGPAGVLIEQAIAVPSFSLGLFALRDLSMSLSATLSFLGDPLLTRINVSRRDRPFALTLGPLTGAGFFSLAIRGGKVTDLEMALEYGGTLDIGIAFISARAGIYYKVSADEVVLSGFVRGEGAIDLGIIRIALMVYIGMTAKWLSDGRQVVYGEVLVRLEVTIIFFTIVIQVRVVVTLRNEGGAESIAALPAGARAGGRAYGSASDDGRLSQREAWARRRALQIW